jgi:hypothetical protein
MTKAHELQKHVQLVVVEQQSRRRLTLVAVLTRVLAFVLALARVIAVVRPLEPLERWLEAVQSL